MLDSEQEDKLKLALGFYANRGIRTSYSEGFSCGRDSKAFLEAAIGNTPLIRLRNITSHLAEDIEVYAKAEHMNPGGSVKDRAALAMIFAGEQSGELTPDKTILDATSGNTGIAYAMFAAARGYRVALTLPKNARPARKRILKLYGAEIIETDPTKRDRRRTDRGRNA